MLAASLGFARLAEPVDFGAADGAPADLIFMIAAPAGADDVHLQLLAKLARGLMREDFTSALRAAASAEEVAHLVTSQVQPELLEESGAAASQATNSLETGTGLDRTPASAAGDAAGPAGAKPSQVRTATQDGANHPLIVAVTSCPTGIAHTFMAATALEQAGKSKGIAVHVEGQSSGKIDWLDPALIAAADAVVFAHDLPVKDRARFAGKPMIDVGVKAAVNDAASLIDQALAAIDDPHAERVPTEATDAASGSEESEAKQHWARRL